jgi:hypothetical protein
MQTLLGGRRRVLSKLAENRRQMEDHGETNVALGALQRCKAGTYARHRLLHARADAAGPARQAGARAAGFDRCMRAP